MSVSTVRPLLMLGVIVHSGGMTQPPVPPPDPDDNARSKVPFSRPPVRSANWWKSVPGQLAIVVMVGGLIFILCRLGGVFDTPSGP